VLDFNRRVLLANAIFVDHKVVAPDVEMKYPFGSCTRSFMVTIRLAGIEVNFCFLLALFTAGRAERTSDFESGLVRWLLA
jgi:hypothetical protein